MTHNTREWEDEFADLTKGEIGTDFEGNEYTLWDVCYDHNKDKRTVAEVIADFIHQQLQKAREEALSLLPNGKPVRFLDPDTEKRRIHNARCDAEEETLTLMRERLLAAKK